ncbi:MAG: ABC transporter substrate-binding protein [Actinomycetota bacterium]
MAAVALAAILLTACPARSGAPDGRVRIALRPPSALDPVFIRDTSGLLVAAQIFEPLVRVDPRTGGLKPALASSWKVLDGGRRFRFRIRKGAKFHDGKPVTAEDVRFSLNRLARKATGSDAGFLLDSVAGFEKVNVTGEAPDLEGVAAINSRTLEITLGAPWHDFLYVLTNLATAPVPKADAEPDPKGIGARPVGSGPYRLKNTFRRGSDLTLERFDGYAGVQPRTDTVELQVFERPEAAWRAFDDLRSVDVTQVPPERIEVAEAKYGAAGFSPLAAGLYLSFNLANPKFADPRLREAVSLAIDREAISRLVYAGSIVPADGIVPAGVPGRRDQVCGNLCGQNQSRARRLIDRAFPDGPPALAYDYPAGVADEGVAQSLKTSLREVGVRVRLRPRERELHAFLDLLSAGGHEMFRVAWPAEYPLADWFLNPLFRSGSPDNHIAFASPKIDELLAGARAEKDPQRRVRLYRQIEAAMMKQVVLIPIGFFRNRYAASPRVGGFYVDSVGVFEVGSLELNGS